MTHSATFEQAFSASAFTGRDVFAFAEDKEESLSENTEKYLEFPVEDAIQRNFNTVRILTERSSTLLQHSGMFELVGGFLRETPTFAFPERENTAAPREVLTRIGNYISVENPGALARFIARNGDIAELLERAVRRTSALPHYAGGEISVFSEPADSDYCVYINADFAVESYEEAYALENQVFSEVLEPHFNKVNFRILLSFDTDSDD
ncbi:hypothetical protein KUV35_04910 [Marinobacter salsuginis]|uniref:hypothetical protein n=1 Tax=Marinobacter salsuginis TaxID=418719 RepID=UPI001C9621D4|nr:hypothetical protein [Marinobacter salsuginis]MBY6070620.1 hypothetical protein [Marinobacter salsuginis]